MSGSARPPGGPPPAGGPAPAGATPPPGGGGGAAKAPKGRKSKARARDLSGWAKTRYVARKMLKWGAISVLVLSLVAVLAIYVTYKKIDLPDPNRDFEAQTTTVYYSDGKHVLGQFKLQNRENVSLDQVPQSMQDAVISAEDRSFEDNQGIDPKGIIRAAWSNLHSDGGEQGASTITQQYVKVLYLSQERTWKRKIREAFLAVKLRNKLSSDEILEGYLNTIYFGRGAYGVQAASQAYFEKDVSDLSVAQSAVLASVLNSPSALDPDNGRAARQALLERYRYVLAGMVTAGDLDATRAQQLERRLPKFPEITIVNQYAGQRGYLMTLVEQELGKHFSEQDIEGGGLQVITTLDWDKEKDALAAIKENRPTGRKELHIALASVEPGTGALRAMVGGRNYLRSQINWATTGAQPGSTFKPFAVAAALKNGYTLQSTFDGNSPFTYPDSSTVRNEGQSAGNPSGQSYGSAITLTYATEQSVNTAFADLTTSMSNGPQKVIKAAVAAGIPESSPGLEPNFGVALGSATISPVEMAEAYATFAAEGTHASWYLVDRVNDASGLRYRHRLAVDQAFSQALTSNVTYALQQVVKAGTGTNALALGRPAAGKTGTATADGDDGIQHVSSSWFVGYTPQLATAVMFVRGDGNDPLDGGYLEPFFGGTYPTQTWTSYMTAALEGEPPTSFPDPAELNGTNPTYVPPSTTSSPPTTSQPPSTTSEPPTTTSEPPTTTSEPPTTTSEPSPPTTSEPPTTTQPPEPPTTKTPGGPTSQTPG